MDPFELLKADHRKVEQLFTQLESAEGRAKLQVFEQIRMELELHTQIEESIFYPALEEPKDTHELTLEAYEEHDVVKRLLKELGRARNANDEWEAQAKVLQENVEHHVQEEENELFKKAARALSREDLETLGEQMASEKERLQGRGSKKASTKKASSKKAAKKAGSAKKSGSSKKSASKSQSASRAAKRAGGTKKSASKGASKSRSKKSAKKSAKKR